MRALKGYLLHEHFILFDIEDVVKLLTGQRQELFEGERAIRLFQFRTWFLFSNQDEAKYGKWAEMIAAVKLLERMEDDYFAGEEGARIDERGDPTESRLIDLGDKPPQTLKRIETLREDNAYRQIYDRLIGTRGGLLALLYTPTPANFDQAINDRSARMHIVADLIDYRLRFIQHGGSNQGETFDPQGANHNHALFFCWWPTHEVEGGRGKTSPNKSVSIRTMGTWWKKFEKSASFIYLIQKHGFQQLPMDTDDESFVDNLERESKDAGELLRFLGAYAYLADTFTKAHSDLAFVSVPESVPRVPISTPAFSKAELETIEQYDANYLRMTQ